MRTPEVLKLLNVSKPTLYRWMDAHPKLDAASEHTALGHPFPRPVRREGREVFWDEKAVQEWWAENATSVGRHPSEEPTSITLSWERFRLAMLAAPTVEEVDGETIVNDDMADVLRFERDGDEAKVWFRNVEDAVLFKLKYF